MLIVRGLVFQRPVTLRSGGVRCKGAHLADGDGVERGEAAGLRELHVDELGVEAFEIVEDDWHRAIVSRPDRESPNRSSKARSSLP